MGDIIDFNTGGNAGNSKDHKEEAMRAFHFMKELMEKHSSQIIVVGIAPDGLHLEVFGNQDTVNSVIALEVARDTIMEMIKGDNPTHPPC